MKFVSKISKQGEDLIIKIPRDGRETFRPLHGKYITINIEKVEV